MGLTPLPPPPRLSVAEQAVRHERVQLHECREMYALGRWTHHELEDAVECVLRGGTAVSSRVPLTSDTGKRVLA